jgi:hypothetical protein
MNPLKSKKAIWWSVGLSVLLVGVFAYAVLVPNMVKPFGSDAPDIRVPNMRNVPEQPGALDLDVQGADEKAEREDQ